MKEIFIDVHVCRREAERLRKTADDMHNIRSRLTALAGMTAEAWQGVAANALLDSQEYTLKEFAMLITLVEEAAENIDRVVTAYEQE